MMKDFKVKVLDDYIKNILEPSEILKIKHFEQIKKAEYSDSH